VAEHAATLDHLLGGRLNVAFVRATRRAGSRTTPAVPGARATGPWNRRSDQDARKPRAVRGCVAIIKTAWTHDTFSFKGKYWSYPPEGQRQPHRIRST